MRDDVAFYWCKPVKLYLQHLNVIKGVENPPRIPQHHGTPSAFSHQVKEVEASLHPSLAYILFIQNTPSEMIASSSSFIITFTSQ